MSQSPNNNEKSSSKGSKIQLRLKSFFSKVSSSSSSGGGSSSTPSSSGTTSPNRSPSLTNIHHDTSPKTTPTTTTQTLLNSNISSVNSSPNITITNVATTPNHSTTNHLDIPFRKNSLSNNDDGDLSSASSSTVNTFTNNSSLTLIPNQQQIPLHPSLSSSPPNSPSPISKSPIPKTPTQTHKNNASSPPRVIDPCVSEEAHEEDDHPLTPMKNTSGGGIFGKKVDYVLGSSPQKSTAHELSAALSMSRTEVPTLDDESRQKGVLNEEEEDEFSLEPPPHPRGSNAARKTFDFASSVGSSQPSSNFDKYGSLGMVGLGSSLGSLQSNILHHGSEDHYLHQHHHQHDPSFSTTASFDSTRSTPQVHSFRLAHRLTLDPNAMSHFKDSHHLDASFSDDASTQEETSSSPTPLNIEEIFQVQSLENNSTISMTGYAETFLSSFGEFISSNETKSSTTFSVQGLPNIFIPVNYLETNGNDQSLYGFSQQKAAKSPLLSHLYESEVAELPLHARKMIRDKFESNFQVLLSNSKKQFHLSKSTMKKLFILSSKKHIVEENKWRMFEETLLSRDIRYHNDPKSIIPSSTHLTDYIFPKEKERPRSRSNSGIATLKPYQIDVDKQRALSPPPSLSPLSLTPIPSPSLTNEPMFRRKGSDTFTNSPTDDTHSSKGSAYDSSDSDDEEREYITNFNPALAHEIPHGFLSTKIENLKEFLRESSDEIGGSRKNVNSNEYKTWKKEHCVLEFLTDELLNTQELKTKMFPFLFNSNECLKDGSTDLLLQSFEVMKPDIDNRAKLIIEIEKFKLDFIEEYLNGVALEQFYGAITLYETKPPDGSHTSFVSGIKRYSETFTFSLASGVNSKKALFYLSPQNLPNYAGQKPKEKVYVLLRLFRNFKGNYTEYFDDLYVKGKQAMKPGDKINNVNELKEMKAIRAVKSSFFESLKDVYAPFAWSIMELDSMLSSLPALQFPSLYVNYEGLSNQFLVKNIYNVPAKLVGEVSDEKLFEVYFANNLNQSSNLVELSTTETGFSQNLSLLSSSTNQPEKTVLNSSKDIVRQLSKVILRTVPSQFSFKVSLIPPNKVNPFTKSLYGKEKQYQYVQRKYLPENNLLVLQKEPTTAEHVTDKKSKRQQKDIDIKDPLQTDLPVTEMEQFYSSNTMPETTFRHFNLRNDLFIYPQSGSFSKFSAKHDNVHLTVSLYDNDTNFSLNTMEQRSRNIFSKAFSGDNPSTRTNEGECVSVSLKAEKPEFSGEIKCAVPCYYPSDGEDSRQHLVFKFYNVQHKESVQQGKKGDTDTNTVQSKTLFGVAFLKIYKKVTTTIDKRKVILKDLINGDFELQVFNVLHIPNSNYLRLCDEVIDPSLSHIKSSGTLKVRIMPYSFIFPNIALSFPYTTSNVINLFLLKFFRLINNQSNCNGAIPPLEEISDAYKTLVQTYEYEKQVVLNTIWFEMHNLYLPMIINTCLEWIIDSFDQNKHYSAELWKIILFFIEKYNQHSAYTATVLNIFQKYHFRLYAEKEKNVVTKLLLSFVESIRIENTRLGTKGNIFEELFIRNNQILFGLFLKAIICSMIETPVPNSALESNFDNSHLLSKTMMSAIEQFTVMVLEVTEKLAYAKTEKHGTLRIFLKNFSTFYAHLVSIFGSDIGSSKVKSTPLAGEHSMYKLFAKQDILQFFLRFVESIGYFPSLFKVKNNETVTPSADNKRSREMSNLAAEVQLIMLSELLLHFPAYELSLPPSIPFIESIILRDNFQSIQNFRDIHHFVFSSFAEYFIRCVYLNEDKEQRTKAILLFKEYVEKVSRECTTMQHSEEPSHPITDPQKLSELRLRIFTSQFLLELFAKHMIDLLPEWKKNADSNQKKITLAIEELKRKIAQVERDKLSIAESAKQGYKSKKEPEKKLPHLEVQLTTLKQLLAAKEKQLLEEFEATKTEKRMLLSIFIQTITNCDEKILRALWKMNHEETDYNTDNTIHFSSKLLMAFQMCLQSFEYSGYTPLYHFYERVFVKQTTTSGQSSSNTGNVAKQTNPTSAAHSSSGSIWKASLTRSQSKNSTKTSLDGQGSEIQVDDSLPKSNSANSLVTHVSKTDFIERKINMERHISHETGTIIFQMFLKFMEDNCSYIENALPKGNIDPKRLPPLIENIVRTVLNLLRSNLSETLTVSVLMYMRHALCQYPFTAVFYHPQSEYGLLVAEELLRLSHSKLGSIRKHAAACFYLWIRFCFEENKGMTVPQIMTTLALSRRLQTYTNINSLQNILNNDTLDSFDDSQVSDALRFIEECIKMLPYFALKDEAAPGSKFFKIRNKYGKLKGQDDLENPNLPLDKIGTDKKQEHQQASTSIMDASKPKGERFHNAMVFFKKIETKADQKKHGQKVLEVYEHFHELLAELSRKLLNLVQDTVAIRATMIKRKQSSVEESFTYDPFKTEELLYRISENYSKLPELRLAWLEQLASYHKGLNQYEESAHCYLRILSLVFDYLDHANQRFNAKNDVSLLDILPLSQFYGISPMLNEFKSNQTGFQTQTLLGGANTQLDYMSDHSIVKYILRAIDCLELSECYEHCILLYKMLIPIFESKYANYAQLHAIYERLTQLYKKCASFQASTNAGNTTSSVPSSPRNNSTSESNDASSLLARLSSFSSLNSLTMKVDSSETDTRVYSFYYRVKFIGRAFGELNGQVFIYKMPKLFKLYKMKNKMIEIYGKDIEVVSKEEEGVTNESEDDLSSISVENKKIIQINHVKPFLPTVDQMKVLKRKFDDLNRINSSSFGVNSAPSWRGGLERKAIGKKPMHTSSASKLPTMISDSLSPRSRSSSNPKLELTLLNFSDPSRRPTISPMTPTSPTTNGSPSDRALSPSKVTIPKLNLSKSSSSSEAPTSSTSGGMNSSVSNSNAFQELERFLYDRTLSLTFFIPRETEFERNMNINQFFYEYSVSKSKNADITQTEKKKIVITTEEYFPNVTTRVPVVEEKVFTLSPIENSIEMIDTQVKKLEGAMNLILSGAVGDVSHYSVLANLFNHSVVNTSSSSTSGGGLNNNNSSMTNLTSSIPTQHKRRSTVGTNMVINLNITSSLGNIPYLNEMNITPHTLSNLQMILQGSVQARVGEGPKKVVEAFLNKEYREFWKKHHNTTSNDLVERLNERCFRFLLLCERGVKLHSLMIHSQAPTAASTNKDRVLHAELEKGYHEVKSLFENYLVVPRVRTLISSNSSSGAISPPERVTNLKNKDNSNAVVETYFDVSLQDALNYPELFYKHNHVPYSLIQTVMGKIGSTNSGLGTNNDNSNMGQQHGQHSIAESPRNNTSSQHSSLLLSEKDLSSGMSKLSVHHNPRLSIPSTKMKEYLEQLGSIDFDQSKMVNEVLSRSSVDHSNYLL
ncbi:hypothetical protein C9374_006526 [Naegleria lovaniensis]|uniref:DOCK family protein n=1 Tax=Naegleria lovaniensis TaxID=51637 RepID=A0AA88GNF0_NAELO|nr:uncharacterized protein C9374_006526 [Naegleria lovaniensis]KAG2381537.1 hypothetical protein C9374_006526 [Naegleria lovaniensis]